LFALLAAIFGCRLAGVGYLRAIAKINPRDAPGAHHGWHLARDVEVHRSAHKHGITDTAIHYALEHAMTVFDLEPDADPPKVLAIGSDPAGNLLELLGSNSRTSIS
jgi:hypothetical protein